MERKVKDISLVYAGQNISEEEHRLLDHIKDRIMNPYIPFIETLDFAYNQGSNKHTGDDYDYTTDHLINDAIKMSQISEVMDQINTMDGDYGFVWKLFDLIYCLKEKNPFTITDVFNNYLKEFFNSRENFWCAYKCLVFTGVIYSSLKLEFTHLGNLICDQIYESGNSN